jgi:hypothetical protein
LSTSSTLALGTGKIDDVAGAAFALPEATAGALDAGEVEAWLAFSAREHPATQRRVPTEMAKSLKTERMFFSLSKVWA